jgi:hypothetical protein
MRYACIALLVTLMCHTSYAAWFIVPVFVLYALICRPRRVDVVIAVIVAGLLLVPWLIYQGYVEVTDQTQMLAHMQWVAPFDVRLAMSAPAKLLVGFDRSPLVCLPVPVRWPRLLSYWQWSAVCNLGLVPD